MNCSKCKKPMRSLDKFCGSCAHPVNESKPKQSLVEVPAEYKSYQKMFGFQDSASGESGSAYVARIIYCGRKFDRLKKHEKEFVYEAAKNGFMYRGDDFKRFGDLYDDYLLYKSMSLPEKKEYAMKALLGLRKESQPVIHEEKGQ